MKTLAMPSALTRERRLFAAKTENQS